MAEHVCHMVKILDSIPFLAQQKTKKQKNFWASKMSQMVKAIVIPAWPSELVSLPGTHMKVGESHLSPQCSLKPQLY